uniref:BHLH domain-containing protein n=1 Tax=Parascaris univalens TaxID=6257 RepID=A0A915C744_PARUN
MSLFPPHNDFEEDLAMIPEIADIATEQFLKDTTLSKLALEIRIEPRQMNRRRVIVRVAPKEDINMARLFAIGSHFSFPKVVIIL